MGVARCGKSASAIMTNADKSGRSIAEGACVCMRHVLHAPGRHENAYNRVDLYRGTEIREGRAAMGRRGNSVKRIVNRL